MKKSTEEKPKGGKGPEGIGEIIGKHSKRSFNPEKAGGEILNLSWKNAKVTREGLGIVKKHLERFEPFDWNEKMIERLEKILRQEIEVTDFDKRFYTHEMREFERYKELGFENTPNFEIPKSFDVWNDTHSATLEDFKIYEKMNYEGKEIFTLYHPSVQP